MNLKKLETLCKSDRYANIEHIETLSRMRIARYSIVYLSRLPKKHNSWKFMVYADDIQKEIRIEL